MAWAHANMENPLSTVDLLLFGNPNGVTWSGVIPDRQGLLNAAKYVSTTTVDSEWANGMLGLLRYLPDPELEDILVSGKLKNFRSITVLTQTLASNAQGLLIRDFGRIGDLLRKNLIKYDTLTDILDKKPRTDILSTYRPDDAEGLANYLKCTAGMPLIERTNRQNMLFSYIKDDETFKKVLMNVPGKSHWEKFSLLKYKGLANFPELGSKCMLTLAAHITTAPMQMAIPDWVVPKTLFNNLPTKALLSLFLNSPMVRKMERFPELRRYAAPWIIKSMGKKETYEQACLKAEAVNHAPMQKYRELDGKVDRNLLVDLYLANHLFVPTRKTFDFKFLESKEYLSIPDELKISDAAKTLFNGRTQ